MSLRRFREDTTPAEHAQAVSDAETRLGRTLSAGEKRIDIAGIDRDLKNGKKLLHEAILAEQKRAVRAWVEGGTPIKLKITPEMEAALTDLYDAGVEHATAELEAAGVTVE